jgi:hypothetical protein
MDSDPLLARILYNKLVSSAGILSEMLIRKVIKTSSNECESVVLDLNVIPSKT